MLRPIQRQLSSQSVRKMTKFDIEIVSDTVCPWCFVGKQKLDRAIKTWKTRHPESNDEFTVTWKPFYLNPGMPTEGVDKETYMIARFGAERLKVMHERLGQIGRDNDINFSFKGRTGNTRSSHRLIQLGKTKSPAVQTRVVEELFKSYFEESGDITSHAMLTAAGVKAGLEESEVKAWLESDQGGKEVDREVDEARELGISGVPNFTVQGRYQIGGAQDEGVFLNLWEKLASAEAGRAANGVKIENHSQAKC